jgi:hypothetical protein
MDQYAPDAAPRRLVHHAVGAVFGLAGSDLAIDPDPPAARRELTHMFEAQASVRSRHQSRRHAFLLAFRPARMPSARARKRMAAIDWPARSREGLDP